MQQGAQNALDKLRKRSPKGRRAPSRLSIYTYTRAPHNVNGEIAHCALRSPKLRRPRRVEDCAAARTHKPFESCRREARLGRLPAVALCSPPCHDGRLIVQAMPAALQPPQGPGGGSNSRHRRHWPACWMAMKSSQAGN
jgi:hypothetical protein